MPHHVTSTSRDSNTYVLSLDLLVVLTVLDAPELRAGALALEAFQELKDDALVLGPLLVGGRAEDRLGSLCRLEDGEPLVPPPTFLDDVFWVVLLDASAKITTKRSNTDSATDVMFFDGYFCVLRERLPFENGFSRSYCFRVCFFFLLVTIHVTMASTRKKRPWGVVTRNDCTKFACLKQLFYFLRNLEILPFSCESLRKPENRQICLSHHKHQLESN